MTTPIKRDSRLPVMLDDELVPLDGNGQYVPHHLDAGGTVHWFSVVDARKDENPDREAYELRYYRAAQDIRGEIIHDSHPVMPLADRARSPFPLPALQLMLEEGDLQNAQELAYHTAAANGLPFPDPVDLPDLNSRPDYYFGLSAGDDGRPALEAVKTWMEGSERHFATQTIATYTLFEEAASDEHELDDLLKKEGLEPAMNLAESMAVANGTLHDGRDDPRLFSKGPRDPFQTNLEHKRAQEVAFTREYSDTDMQPLALETAEPALGIEQFREQFSTSAYRLLEPIDPMVNYSFEVTAADPWTLELTADKWWLEADGRVGHDSQTLNTYSQESFEFEREIEREVAAMDRESLHRLYKEDSLEAAMRKAERMAVANGALDPTRADGRLFPQGPIDRFTTLRETELAGLDTSDAGKIWRDITEDETQELPAVVPETGSWEELLDQRGGSEPEPEHHYWQMHYRPVETPDGEQLGTALFVTEFPQLPTDFDSYVEENGMDDSIYPTEARTLEMAHFENEEDARKFEAEFRAYLVPGLLDGPELAPEVAKLEGLAGTWEEMDYRGIVDYMSGSRTIVHEPEDWQLHNPNPERELQEQLDSTQHDIDF